jgi:GT2 family glycosyltransferase
MKSCAIILNWCTPESTLNACLDIRKYCNLDYIIIVDNNSPDGSFEILKEDSLIKVYDNIFVLNTGHNSGYAGGNNYALRFALNNFIDIDIFWIVNSDVRIHGDMFLPILEEIKHKSDCFYGSLVLNSDEKIECYGGGLIYPIFGKCKLLGKGKETSELDTLVNRLPDYLMGCSLAFTKDVIDKVGLMDESYFMYSEEIDWQWRAKKLGIGIKVVPESIIYHEGSGSSGGQSPFYFFYRNRAAIMLNKKFFGNTFAFISAINLSFITLIQNAKNKENVTFGIKGAWAGLFKGIKFD